MNDNKVYVEVIVKFSTEGAMMPIEFIWEDGTKYLIDKVKSKERCASRNGVLPVKRTMKNNNFFSVSLLTGWRYFYAAFNVSS